MKQRTTLAPSRHLGMQTLKGAWQRLSVVLLMMLLTATTAATTIETKELAAGWNWFSTNCDITLDDLKAALVEALPGTSITIQSQAGNTKYNCNNNRWTGRLYSLDVVQMYMIQVNASCDITLEGMPINPAEHPITIHNGDNWIGFPFAQSMSVANAFAGFAVNGDVIISQTASACYSNGAWKGTLKYLEPGQGYIYKSAASGDRTFAYPGEGGDDSGSNDSFNGQSHWEDFDYHSYQYNRPVVAAIMIDGQYVTADDYDLDDMEVAAFVGEDCRGNRFTLTDRYVENDDEQYPVLDGMPVYYDTSGQEVTFRLYANDIEYTNCEILYEGTATDINTGDVHVEGWMDPEHPIILSFISPAVDLVLSDTGANADAIEQNNNRRANVTLQGRTLYKDGSWNTLCLPFDVTLSGSTLDGAEARRLTEASISGATLNLTFSDPVEELKAGVPYIIKWEKTDGYVDDDAHNIVSPAFSSVTVNKEPHNYDSNAETDLNYATDARVRFIGTYKNLTFSTDDSNILMMGGENKLYYPQPDLTTDPDNPKYPTIGACRAYFKIGDDINNARQLTAFHFGFGDGSDETGIREAVPLNDKGQMINDKWYDLQGRLIVNGKLSNGKLPKGLYIHNGKKVVVK